MSRNTGDKYERLALAHLKAKGLKLIAKNFCCRQGEVDLVLCDGDCLVFAEVRYRAGNRFASAAHSIGPGKQMKITQTASMFLARNPRYGHCPVRFDVIAFDGAESEPAAIQWIRDAFRI